jgi:hypothetical protein
MEGVTEPTLTIRIIMATYRHATTDFFRDQEAT